MLALTALSSLVKGVQLIHELFNKKLSRTYGTFLR